MVSRRKIYGIEQYPDVASASLCERLTAFCEKPNYLTYLEHAHNGVAFIDEIKPANRDFAKALDLIKKTLLAYINKYVGAEWVRNSTIDNCYTLEPRITRYLPGEYFGPHSDDGGIINLPRRFSYVLYLNDNFKGGNTIFTSGEEEIARIKPKTGSLLIFPSHPIFVHEGDMVYNGTKYILNGFARIAEPTLHNVHGGSAAEIRDETDLLRDTIIRQKERKAVKS